LYPQPLDQQPLDQQPRECEFFKRGCKDTD
jgi:hypothetical protein